MSPKFPVGQFPMELPWPFGGLSDEYANDDQPPATTSDAQNVRNLDGGTGRIRGSKRPGRSKQNGTTLGSLARELVSVRYNQKTIDYAANTGDLWTATTPDGSDCWWIETDGDGNVYALNGDASIAKYSASGTLVTTFTLPVKSSARVGTLDVDEGANVFCGVSGRRGLPVSVSGSQEPGNGMILGNTDHSRLWKLRHAFRNNDDETEPELEVAWTLTTDPEDPGPTLWGLIGFVRVKGGKLYTIQHDNNRWRSWLVVYDLIHAGIPVESRVQRIPYPASMLDVSVDGKIVVSVEAFTKRGLNPEHPECSADIDAWTVLDNIDDDIDSAAEKHQPWFVGIVDKKYLLTSDGIEPEDGAEVLYWLDAGPGGRHMKFSTAGDGAGPIYRENGLGGKPSIWCDGETSLLVASASPTQSADFRDQQRGLFPTYKDTSDADRSAQYAVIALMRPEADATASITAQYPLWDHAAGFSNLTGRSSILINRKASDTLASASNTESGSVSWYCEADSGNLAEGTSTGRSPAYMTNAFSNAANALLVSAIFCNGVDTGVNTSTRSLLRINGKPVDRFEMDGDVLGSKLEQFLMGFDPLGGNYETGGTPMSLCRGEWCELVVLDRRDLDSVGADAICTHPIEPDSSTGNAVGQVRITNEGSGGTPTTDSGTLSFTGFTLGPGGSPPTGTWASVDGKLTTVALTSTGKNLLTQPSVAATGFNGSATLASSMIYAPEDKTPTILEKIEASFAWRRGVAYIMHSVVSLPSAGAYTVTRANTSGTAGTYTWTTSNPFYEAVGTSPFNADIGAPETNETPGIHRYAHRGELLILMDASGKLLDVKSHDQNGVGLGCRFNAEGTAVYTAGNTNGSDATGLSLPADIASVRKWTIGADNTLTSAWAVEGGLRMSGQWCGLKVDAAGNVYVPCNAPLDTADAFRVAVLASADGSTIAEFKNATASLNYGTYCVALPRSIVKADLESYTPDYDGDVTTNVVENFYLSGKVLAYDGTTATPNVRKYRMVTSTPNGDAPTLRQDLAVANGTIYRYDNGVPTAVTGGSAVLNVAAGAYDYVHTAIVGEKAYFTDGSTDIVYDPKTTTASEWSATHGELPPRCRIVEEWHGRAVRTGDGTGAVHMSRVLYPDNWDKSPPTPTVDQACDFATTQVGDVPYAVTGFVPASNDTALIGTDKGLWLLRGDPMANGRLDEIPGSVGMAFGRAWCRGPGNTVWFFGTNPAGLYLWDGGIPEEVSDLKVKRRLAAIDLTTHYVRLAYDTARKGIWIMVIPYAYPTAIPLTYFYEIKQGAFFEDYIDDVDKTVTAILSVDGDTPSTRRILTGHADGYIRYVDTDKSSDDGTAIQASVLMGPFKSPIDGHELRTLKLGCTMASEQNGLAWAVYASDRPDTPGTPKRQGTFGAGSNALAACRTLGSYFWLQLVDTSAASRFALERAWIRAERAGIQRVRS